jgi:diaminopimelate decarboxylase
MENKTKLIKNLMTEYNRPFYLYDESIINRQIEILLKKFLPFEFLYSIKANPFTPIVNFMASHKFGVDAASSEEVMIAWKAGMTSEKILYSSPGKTQRDIEKTIDKSIIIADSYHELALLNHIAKKKKLHIKIGLRINPDYSMGAGKGASSKFGVDEETLIQQKNILKNFTNIEIVGIHVHLRSQILNHNQLYRYYEKIFKLALFCKETMGWKLEFINFGGGLGIAYSLLNDIPLDIELLGDKCRNLFQRFKNKLKVRLMIETGRFVVCEAGQYVTHIIDIKESRGIKYLIVENALNGFFRPSIAELITAYAPQNSKLPGSEPLFTSRDAFEFSILNKKDLSPEKVSIVGNLCTSTDIMAKDILLPKADIGDIFIVSKAGSYSYSLSPLLFASHSLPLQFYLKTDGKICKTE